MRVSPGSPSSRARRGHWVVALVIALGAGGGVVTSAGCSTTSDDGSGNGATPEDPPRAPSCTNKVIDPGEEGIDCGGSVCPKCDGAECTRSEDCTSGDCVGGKCAASPEKTCGVGVPILCADGAPCTQDLDCTSDLCNGTCAAPTAAAHEDGRRNAGETGIDCGGSVRTDKPCPEGQKCKESADCISTCNASGTCDAPGPTDQKQNNGETDVDCGGPNAPKCAVGKVCDTNDDCVLLACTSKACVIPTATDETQNGGESDVDCGGPGVSDGTTTYTPPRCKDAKKCVADGDCVTGACSPAGVCVAKSCDTAESAGITTCGAKEVGDGAAVHETCCKSLTLPTRTTRRLDKYEVTAGRFRSFLTAVGPNVRQFVQAYAAANPSSQLKTLVTNYPNVVNIYPSALQGALGLVAHMQMDIDNYGGTRGCFNGTGNYAANTYWMPKDDIDDWGLPERNIPRETSDAKSLNCAQPLMFAAFCAWDGGELAMMADILDAWGPTAYPWGASDIGRPNYNWCNGDPGTGGFTCQDTALGANGTFYRFPDNTNLALDMEPLIASPGRFVTDATLLKSNGESWMDLFGNLIELTGDFAGSTSFCDFSGAPVGGAPTCTSGGRTGTAYTGIPTVRSSGASWEGHRYARNNTNTFAATFQYGKFGARCVRPAQ